MLGSRYADGAALLILFLLSGWVSSQFGQLAGHQIEANIAKDYNSMAVFSLLIALAAASKFAFFDFVGLEKDSKELISIFIIGAVAGTVITSSGKLALTKIITGAGAIDPTLSWTFVVVLAVFIEEYFFRGALYKSLVKLLSSAPVISKFPYAAIILAAVLASFAFASWHVSATHGDSAALQGEFVYGLFNIFLLEMTGSLGAPIGSHLLRNIITTLTGGG